jgi:lipid-A-disaccharide synthase
MSFNKYKKILILTGEVSGDMHAGYLLKHLKELAPNLEVLAIGSNNLQKAGATIIKDITKKSTIGFLETLKNIPMLYLLKNRLVKLLKKQNIDLLICIDFQGFNTIIAKKAKEMGIQVAYYIPPQEWVWGSEKGVESITKITDKIVTIFQEEIDAYQKYTQNVRFFGHPLTQIIEETKLPVVKQKNTIAVFPGSRKQEIKNCFPEMIKIIKKLHSQDKKKRFIINLPNEHFRETIQKQIKGMYDYISITIGETYPTLAKSEFALVTSGTITLECVLMGTPHAIFYKFNPISFLIIKKYLKEKFKYDNYSLTNILAGKEVVPEYMQKFDTIKICEDINSILADENKIISLKETFQTIKNKLSAKKGQNVLLEISKYILS